MEEPKIPETSMPKTIPPPGFILRRVVRGDIPALHTLISLSVRELHEKVYTPVQISLAIQNLYIVNPLLVDDGTFLAVSTREPKSQNEIVVGCGGWTTRHLPGNELLNPETEAAKLKALYVHPAYGRRGIAKVLLEACEEEARCKGFTRMEFIATLAGVDFYQKNGYEIMDGADGESGKVMKDIGEGQFLEFMSMGKRL